MGLVIPSTGTNAKLLVGDSIETQNGFLIAPAINYIKNALFTSNTTTGWATYADAAGTTPVDGTGGSPNVTFTAVSGATVRGTYAGRLTKDASNRQGQGASYNFTIDAADTGRPVSIAFDFLASSAYVANDVGVYIYDVTNATLITPAAINVAAGKGTFRAFFVATTSTSYRLILHVASTNASAWTLDTDNFQVGPQVQLSGSPSTDFRTVTGASINWTNTTVTAQVAQDADRGRFRIAVVATGTPGAVSSAIVTLPTGFVIDSSKLLLTGVGETTLGTATIQDDGVANYGPYVVAYESTTTVRILNVTTSAPHAFAVGDSITLDFVAPVVGFSSNTVMAERAVEEYAADDGTNDVFGPAGALVPNQALGTLVSRDFSFQGVRQETSNLIVEYNNGSGWTNAAAYFPFVIQGTNTYGVRGFWNSSTVYRVVFGAGGAVSDNATYGNNGSVSWASLFSASNRFRVRMVNGGAVVGYPVGARNVVGDTTGTAVPQGFIGEELIATRTSNVSGSTTSASYTDITGLSLTLTPGVWDVESFATVTVEGATGTAGQGFTCHLVLTDSSNAIITGALGGIANASQPEAVSFLRPCVRRLITTNTVIKARFAPITYGGTPTATGCQVIAAAGYPATIRAVRVG